MSTVQYCFPCLVCRAKPNFGGGNSIWVPNLLKVCVVCVLCVCCVIPFFLDDRFVHVPAGVTQEEGHTGFLHLPYAVLALNFLARRIQPFLSLVDREVEFCVLRIKSFSTCWAFSSILLYFCGEKFQFV